MAATGTITQVNNNNQTELLTFSGGSGSSGNSPAFALPGGFANAVLIVQSSNYNSGTVLLQGSNDGGTTWYTIKDWQNSACSFAANGMTNLSFLPALLQFSWSGGAPTALTAYISYNRTYY